MPAPLTSPIIRSDDLRAENRHRILQTIRRQGPSTRGNIGVTTSLSQAAVSTLSTQMVDEGILLDEKNTSAVRRGRPQTTLTLADDAALAITVTLTIDRLYFRAIDYAGTTLDDHRLILDTRALSSTGLAKLICDGIAVILPSNATLTMIGVGFQGVTEHATGDLLWSPILGIERVPLRRMLENTFKVPVNVNNDCRLIAGALHCTHASVLGNNFTTILFSHGVGMGLYLDGIPFAGIQSSALEIGHLQHKLNGSLCRCGKLGCIEAYAADYGIARQVHGGGPDSFVSGRVSQEKIRSIVHAAHAGDQTALQAFTLAGKAVGAGLKNVFTLFDVMPVAFVGRSKEALDLMANGLNEHLSTTPASEYDIESLVHCFSDDEPLLQHGLNLDALSSIDRMFASDSLPAVTSGLTA